MDFQPFPKIPRLRRDIVITEKIDGTNACIAIGEDGEFACQSRNKIITPGKQTDNAGFAAWAYEHKDTLIDVLGPGRHFGEWFGKGIQRGYGLDGRFFALFNVNRWRYTPEGGLPFEFVKPELFAGDNINLTVVPVLAVGAWGDSLIEGALNGLALDGSSITPGFGDPEGIVVYHKASGSLFKVLLENDELPKGVTTRLERDLAAAAS